MNSNFILDPTPDEWLDACRIQSLHDQISSSLTLLDEGNMLNQVVKFFIERECISESEEYDTYLSWASSMWGKRLDQLYLENKQFLDQYSYRILRVSNQGLALELHHRLSESESTFEKLTLQYGEGPERFHGGLFKLTNFENLPNGIARFLVKLSVGQTSKPIQMGKKFGIIQLVELIPAVRGPDVDQRLLERQFQLWLKAMTDHLVAHLKSGQ